MWNFFAKDTFYKNFNASVYTEFKDTLNLNTKQDERFKNKLDEIRTIKCSEKEKTIKNLRYLIFNFSDKKDAIEDLIEYKLKKGISNKTKKLTILNVSMILFLVGFIALNSISSLPFYTEIFLGSSVVLFLFITRLSYLMVKNNALYSLYSNISNLLKYTELTGIKKYLKFKDNFDKKYLNLSNENADAYNSLIKLVTTVNAYRHYKEVNITEEPLNLAYTNNKDKLYIRSLKNLSSNILEYTIDLTDYMPINRELEINNYSLVEESYIYLTDALNKVNLSIMSDDSDKEYMLMTLLTYQSTIESYLYNSGLISEDKVLESKEILDQLLYISKTVHKDITRYLIDTTQDDFIYDIAKDNINNAVKDIKNIQETISDFAEINEKKYKLYN